MQTTQTLSEGLKREFKVVLHAADLAAKLDNELDSLKDKVRINGFRPGKVPVGHLRRLYGRAVMADVVQNAVNEANRKIIEDNKLKLAMEPQVVLPEAKDEVEAVMEAKADLAFTVALEVLPQVEIRDHSDIAVTRQIVEVDPAEVDQAVERMARQNRAYEETERKKAQAEDRVTVDFVGRIDGTEFQGGSGTDIKVELGSNTFIPGFEEQLVGGKIGEQRLVKVTFPTNYAAEHLAGKDAEFDVTIKAIEAPKPLVIDDELAKAFGMSDLTALKEAIKGQISREYEQASRAKVKKELLDALDAKYDFELPPSLVEQEFGAIWASLEADMKRRGETFESEGKTEAQAREEYLAIAKRRVRLGLVMAEVGEKAEVKVSDDELTQGVVERARQFPGQEKAVWEYYQKNPQALAEIRAPIFEEKVVDLLLGQVKVTDVAVTKEALMSDDEADASAADEKPKAKKAKAPAKKKAEKTEGTDAE